MFFVASKLFGFVAAPSNTLALVGLAGAALAAAGFDKAGTAAMAVSSVGLAVAGFSPLGNLLMLPLEERFPRASEDPEPAGVVVLGGSFDTAISGARHDVALAAAAERVTVVAELARRWPQARIVFSGGSNALADDGVTEAELARRMFLSFGVAAQRLTLEDRSRNTVENARFSRDAAAPHAGERWLLVTSAYHMPRAVGCFRAAGFAVEAWPVDHRTRGPQDAWRPSASFSGGLRRVDIAVREWVGLVTYWLLGYVTAPLPRP